MVKIPNPPPQKGLEEEAQVLLSTCLAIMSSNLNVAKKEITKRMRIKEMEK
jgi:hypothetical protein